MNLPKSSKLQKIAAYITAIGVILGGMAWGVSALGSNRPALLSESIEGDKAILELIEVMNDKVDAIDDRVDKNTIPINLPIYDMYKRALARLTAIQKQRPLTIDERDEMNYARIQLGVLRKKLLKAGHDPEPKKD